MPIQNCTGVASANMAYSPPATPRCVSTATGAVSSAAIISCRRTRAASRSGLANLSRQLLPQKKNSRPSDS